jgi:SAM-dependent methyltransferase
MCNTQEDSLKNMAILKMSTVKSKLSTLRDFAGILRGRLAPTQSDEVVLSNTGYCLTCTSKVTFVAKNTWLRDYYLCSKCGSIPRERAMMQVIGTYFPDWKNLIIHESSPVLRGASRRLANECKGYIPSQLFPDKKPGSTISGVRCENLEKLSFADNSIDLHITQDVLEHVFHPSVVFKEIARTLKPGGAHVFTVPLVNKNKPTKLRSIISDDGNVVNLEPPVYHGNPVDKNGSLVTVDWGFDICKHIFDACGLFTQVISIDDLSKGIRAEYIEVLITFKPVVAGQGNIIP